MGSRKPQCAGKVVIHPIIYVFTHKEFTECSISACLKGGFAGRQCKYVSLQTINVHLTATKRFNPAAQGIYTAISTVCVQFYPSNIEFSPTGQMKIQNSYVVGQQMSPGSPTTQR